MHYIMSDIHNDNRSLNRMLAAIHFGEKDHLFLLGDLFDRGDYDPNPVDLYFTIIRLGNQCTIIRGNHDQGLADYILKYYSMPERKRKKFTPYLYNTFNLLKERLTDVDMQNLAHSILTWPVEQEIEIKGKKYYLSHEMNEEKEGYITIFGHERKSIKIYRNEKGTCIGVDCGCGYRDGFLGCLRLEDQEELYLECWCE